MKNVAKVRFAIIRRLTLAVFKYSKYATVCITSAIFAFSFMIQIKSSTKQSIHIWIAVALLFVAAIIFLCRKNKMDGFESLACFHSKGWDVFFTWFTYIGDALFILLLAVILFFCRRKLLSIGIIISCILSGLIAQILKNIFPSPRPAVLFREMGRAFYEIPGVTLMNSMASFPSGHTTSAFALMTMLVLTYPKSKWNTLWLIMAAAVGYSRMYLGNHFLIDVTVGAFIGILMGFITNYILLKYIQTYKNKNN